MFPLAVTHKGLASVLEVQYLFIFTKKKLDLRQSMAFELNWTIECVVNLDVTELGFVFVLISFLQMHNAVVLP